MHRRNTAAPGPSEEPSAGQTPVPDTDAKAPDNHGASAFECNICFDTPRDPVVTPCGHLYCWSCLYRWMRLHADSPQCPVCKAGVEKRSVIPIYGRGRGAEVDDPRERPLPEDEQLPPRPQGQRPQAINGQRMPAAATAFGMHPAAFGRVNTYGGNYGNLSLSTFGLFPSLFGMQIAYPHMNEPPREHPQLTPEQETQEQVAKVFLFLALFILAILTLF